ncbi:MAG: IS4 family transposase [Chlorobi bacterium]|nr:IS4 family transposase [Chlorobiota bacterium]
MLGRLFQPFIDESPISVMARGLLERSLNPTKLDQWFERAAVAQYTRDLLFSSVFQMMNDVVFTTKPSVNAAYQPLKEELGVSVQSVYNKLNAVEPTTSAELVRYCSEEITPIIKEMKASHDPWLPGFRVKILDGNCIEATEHRIKALRTTAAAPLPGKSLVVFDPELDLVIDVFPCEDGHTQERALLSQIFPTIQTNDVWVGDRNFCVLSFLFGLKEKEGFFIIRQHKGLPFEELGPWRRQGISETGQVFEQWIKILDENGKSLKLRRLRVCLNEPTRDGETEIFILTNLPVKVAKAKKIAKIYRQRWMIETAFQKLEKNLNSEINTLGYPKAALFGFCIALVAYNTMSAIKAALRVVHGTEKIENDVSDYYIAREISETYRGMMIAIPKEQWSVFLSLTTAQLAHLFIKLAKNVKLFAFKKYSRGPKKPQVKPKWDPKHPHVSTARLIAG